MKIHLLVISLILSFSFNTLTQAFVWTQKTSFPAGIRAGACAFAIGNKGYVTCGVSTGSFGFIVYNDLWEYNPQTDTWTQMADLPSAGRSSASAFAVNGKGYLCLGWDLSVYHNDLWQYDPVMNSWIQKSDFPGAARYTAASFVIADSAYVGSGKSGGYYSDFYKYNTVNDSWTQVANLGGVARQNERAFTKGNFGYVVGGATDPSSDYYDLWQYDPQVNTWLQKTSYPGQGSFACCAFVLNGVPYVGSGCRHSSLPNTFDDFYSYDPVTDSWTAFIPFGGGIRNSAVCFSIGNKAYMGLGSTGIYPVGTYQQDWWELSDPSGIVEAGTNNSPYIEVHSKEVIFHFNNNIEKSMYLKLYDTSGREIKNYVTGRNTNTFNILFDDSGKGLFVYSFYDVDNKIICSGKFIF